MRKVFISYARANKPDIDQLVKHLGMLSYETWVDSSLRGGQDWWDEILQRIADCDVFMPIISNEALISTACRREFDWAEALSKPVLPVAVEPPPQALPGRFSIRQIVDYSEPGQRDRAAVILSGGLAIMPSAPPLPEPLPPPPAAPLSYLTGLVDLVSDPDALDHEQQRQILIKLEPALRSVDPEERRGGRAVLERFSSRDDLFLDVGQSIDRLRLLKHQQGRVDRDARKDDPGSDDADDQLQASGEEQPVPSSTVSQGALRPPVTPAATQRPKPVSETKPETACESKPETSPAPKPGRPPKAGLIAAIGLGLGAIILFISYNSYYVLKWPALLLLLIGLVSIVVWIVGSVRRPPKAGLIAAIWLGLGAITLFISYNYYVLKWPALLLLLIGLVSTVVWIVGSVRRRTRHDPPS
jgi:hypothetical protein